MNEFEKGQIVEYIGDYPEERGTWEINCYAHDLPITGGHAWECKRLTVDEKSGGTDRVPIGYHTVLFNTSLRAVSENKKTQCTCPLISLMAKGCTCGQMERERRL